MNPMSESLINWEHSRKRKEREHLSKWEQVKHWFGFHGAGNIWFVSVKCVDGQACVRCFDGKFDCETCVKCGKLWQL